ncbi:TIGR01777 family oxidoreductase [Mesonia sp. K7]|uniref:TIGR01777 family oxidoreductase n=1 Tax=Mesonia sp. K7 TaxID=2218606 RepID=UPI000DAA3996|nr:TIGR01777 family oxidoreductase [Mesonia sp. K7]PZD79593.1 TIGR01777 family protein [Mesonia sp. K7]
MRVLITGATGLIGKRLVKNLLEKGYEVNYLTTKKEKIKQEKNYQGFLWNPKDDEIDKSCFQGVEKIFHLAGAPINKRWTTKQKKIIYDSRISTANLIFRTLKANNLSVKQYISASAIGIYPSDFQKLYEEKDHMVADTFLGKVVKDWEKSAEQFKELGVSVAMVRTGLVLSEAGGALPVMIKSIKNRVGVMFASGKQWQSWIHIDDLVGMYEFIEKNNLVGIYNGVATNPVTNRRFDNILQKLLETNVIIDRIPKLFLQIGMGESHILVTDSQLVSNRKINNAGYQFQFNQLIPALKDIVC